MHAVNDLHLLPSPLSPSANPWPGKNESNKTRLFTIKLGQSYQCDSTQTIVLGNTLLTVTGWKVQAFNFSSQGTFDACELDVCEHFALCCYMCAYPPTHNPHAPSSHALHNHTPPHHMPFITTRPLITCPFSSSHAPSSHALFPHHMPLPCHTTHTWHITHSYALQSGPKPYYFEHCSNSSGSRPRWACHRHTCCIFSWSIQASQCSVSDNWRL